MYNGFPLGDFLLESTMPKEVYNALFYSEKSLKQYDCCASLQFLCFFALYDINSAITIAIYDVALKRWSTSFTPNLNIQGIKCLYKLAKCGWIPNWLAKP